MKYNSLIDKNEDLILDKLKQHYKKANFDVTPNGYVNQVNIDCDITITQKLADELQLFDKNGICRIKFNYVGGDFCISGVDNIKSYENLPLKGSHVSNFIFKTYRFSY